MRIISKVATLAAIAYKTSIGELALLCRSGCMIMRVRTCARLHTSCGRCWLWPGVLQQAMQRQLMACTPDSARLALLILPRPNKQACKLIPCRRC